MRSPHLSHPFLGGPMGWLFIFCLFHLLSKTAIYNNLVYVFFIKNIVIDIWNKSSIIFLLLVDIIHRENELLMCEQTEKREEIGTCKVIFNKQFRNLKRLRNKYCKSLLLSALFIKFWFVSFYLWLYLCTLQCDLNPELKGFWTD